MLTAYFSSSGVPITRIYFASFRYSSIAPFSADPRSTRRVMVCREIMKRGHSTRDDGRLRLRFEKIRNLSWLSYDLQLRNRQTSWNFVNSGGISSETKTEVCPRIGGPRMFGISHGQRASSSAQALLGIVSLATSPALKRSMVGGSAALCVQTLR
jgi:hypothetical protein